ncbi:S-layer homology domain-containing protein [Paenibacillus oryzisoli]|uniref:S-layer homology domain-containing protein n=1 Tax=Paenibacillus oryzisoli TaxID=1850517 RepID=UPI003D27182A
MKKKRFQSSLAGFLVAAIIGTLLLLPGVGMAADVEVDVAALPSSGDAAIQWKNGESGPTAMAETNYDTKTGSSLGLFSISNSSTTRKYMYFQFDVSSVADATYNYYLQVSAKLGSSLETADLQVFALIGSAWQENTITWNNAPQTDLAQLEQVGEFTITTLNGAKPVYHHVDVTSYVRQHLQEGPITFVVADLHNTGKSVNIYGKENTSSSNPETQLLVKRVVHADSTPPIWPVGGALKSINIGTDFVELAWPAASDDSAVANYKVYKNDSLLATVTGSTYYTETGLTPNTSVSFAVYAGDAVGNYSTQPLTYSTTTLAAPVDPIPVVEVNASSSDGNVESNTLDNNLFSRWSASGDGQYVMFDLGGTKRIGYVGIAFYKGDQRATLLDIQTSDDASQWTTLFSGYSRPATVNMQAFDILDTDARFVRIVGHGNSDGSTFTSLTEVMIYAPYPSGDTPVAIVPNITPEAPPGTVPFTQPGLTNPDGSVHVTPPPHPVTGMTIDATAYGADPADNGQDDRAAIQQAIDSASPGDEVYLPNGVYNLMSTPDGFTNIKLKTGVNLRGENEAGTIIRSSIDDIKNSAVIKSSSQHDILVSNLTITSTWNRQFSTEHATNNPDAGGPDSMIAVANYGETPSHSVTIDHVTVERFRRMAIRIENSHDVVVRHSTFRNATDLGGGGAGYGTSIQGMPKVDRLGFENDTYWNVVEDSIFEGPYLRHGSLIQNVAHNNVLRNNTYTNTKLDSIDLHGELEYLNEIYGNTIQNIYTGGGVGLGNTGGTAPSNHSKSGPNNYIHDNIIRNSREGVVVTMGTPDTRIENNIIENTTTVVNAVGINVLNGPGTKIVNNIIRNNTADGYWGILLEHDRGDINAGGVGAGDPANVQITGNTITGNTNGIKLEAGTQIQVTNNVVDNLGTNYEKAAGVTATETWPQPGAGGTDPDTDPGTGSGTGTGSGAGAVEQPLVSTSDKLTTEQQQVDGRNVEVAALDSKAIDQLLKQQPNGSVRVVVEAGDGSLPTRLNVSGEALKKLQSSGTLVVETQLGGVKLPVQAELVAQWAAQAGVSTEQLQLSTQLESDPAAAKEAKKQGLRVAASLDFSVQVIGIDGKAAEISEFPHYVPFMVNVKEPVNEKQLAAVRVVEGADGKMTYQPVPFTVQNGQVTVYSHSADTILLVERSRSFSDSASHWAKEAIEQMANKWIVEGTGGDTFEPDKAITRAELAALLTRTLGLAPSASEPGFTDTTGSEWYAANVQTAVEAGIITGYEDGSFRPEQTITREEMAVMLNRALAFAGYQEAAGDSKPINFGDQVRIQPWAASAVEQLAQLQLMDGVNGGAFEPEQAATRAQVAVVLKRMLQVLTFRK